MVKAGQIAAPKETSSPLTPSSIVAIFIGAQLIFWTLLPGLSYSAPPLDVTESLVWGREWLLGTHKHPPLPSWLLEAGRATTGSVIWWPFLLSQICVVLTIWCAFLLGRDILGAEKGAMGALLLAGIFYFSWPTPEFNHNVIQMPIWVAVPLFLRRALKGNGLADWLTLGALGALAIYGKYSAIMLLVFVPVWLVATLEGRTSLTRPGPSLAMALCVLLVLPELLWLIRHDFQPLEWATLRSGGGGTPLTFLGAQLADHLPILLIAGPAGLLGRAMLRPAGTTKDRRFLLMFGLGPLVLTVIGAVVGGSGLKDMWGMSMFGLSGLLLVAWFGGRVQAARLQRSLMAVLLLVAFVSVAHGLLIAKGPTWFGLKPMRGAWPMAQISAAVTEFHAERSGGAPLRIVISDFWIGGLSVLDAPGTPSVMLNGDPRIAPWVEPGKIAVVGAVVVWQITPRRPLPDFGVYSPARAEQRTIIPWQGSDRPPLVLGMAYIPPTGN